MLNMYQYCSVQILHLHVSSADRLLQSALSFDAWNINFLLGAKLVAVRRFIVAVKVRGIHILSMREKHEGYVIPGGDGNTCGL